MGAALAGCCALAGISVVGQPVAADDAAGVPDVFVSGRDVLTEPGEVDVENTGFGRWRVGIGLAAAAYVPGDGRALGFESQAGDPLLTLVDVWTGETESGPSITQEANRLDVSTDGSVAFVRWGGVGGADAARHLRSRARGEIRARKRLSEA